MTILFTCPHCGTQTDVYDEYAGQSGPCVVCGKLITVPYLPPATASAGTPAYANLPPGRARRSSASFAVVAAVVAGGLLAIATIALLLFMVVFPAVANVRSSSHKNECAKNLRRITLALHQYEAKYGSFPPAYLADAQGKPMHSWRVLLLPFLGYEHVYRQYNFAEPWDGPRNMSLRRAMPPEYACPADPDARSQDETNYMVLVGSETMFPKTGCVKREMVTDGVQNTLLLVETPASGVCWMEPKDMDFGQMQFTMNGKPGIDIGSRHLGGAHVVTVDGECHFLQEDATPDIVRGLGTIQGQETILPEVFGFE